VDRATSSPAVPQLRTGNTGTRVAEASGAAGRARPGGKGMRSFRSIERRQAGAAYGGSAYPLSGKRYEVNEGPLVTASDASDPGSDRRSHRIRAAGAIP
jgi:hypothetical protein